MLGVRELTSIGFSTNESAETSAVPFISPKAPSWNPAVPLAVESVARLPSPLNRDSAVPEDVDVVDIVELASLTIVQLAEAFVEPATLELPTLSRVEEPDTVACPANEPAPFARNASFELAVAVPVTLASPFLTSTLEPVAVEEPSTSSV